MATTADFTTSVEKSITYDRQSKDYRCVLTINDEPISVGYASSYSAGETWCNDEYYRLLTDNVLVPAQPEPDAAPVVAEPLPFEPAPARPMRYPELPPVAISTLIDGTTVYGHFDNDDSQMLARLDTADGWKMYADENGLDLWHQDYEFKFDGMTLDSLAALRTFLNSGVIEHLLNVGAAWGNNEDVPAVQPDALWATLVQLASPAIEVSRWQSDESDNGATILTLGQAEVWIDDKSGIPGLTIGRHMVDDVEPCALEDAVTLFNSPEVRKARMRIEAGLPPLALSKLAAIRRAA